MDITRIWQDRISRKIFDIKGGWYPLEPQMYRNNDKVYILKLSKHKDNARYRCEYMIENELQTIYKDRFSTTEPENIIINEMVSEAIKSIQQYETSTQA